MKVHGSGERYVRGEAGGGGRSIFLLVPRGGWGWMGCV